MHSTKKKAFYFKSVTTFLISINLVLFLFLGGAGSVYGKCIKSLPADLPLSLSGHWQYFKTKQSGFNGYGPEVDDARWGILEVPGYWGQAAGNRKRTPLKGHVGYAWYRCHIVLNGPPIEGLALYLGKVREIDSVYFNGKLIGQTGSFDDPVEVDTQKLRLYSLPTGLWRQGNNLIAVQVRGFGDNSGLEGSPALVDEQGRAKKLIFQDVMATVVSCIYILVAAYFGLFALFFSERKSNLFFSLFSLSMGLYYLIRTQLRYLVFDSFETSFQVELFLLFSLPILFINFISYFMEMKSNPALLLFDVAYALLLIAILFIRDSDGWQLLINLNFAGMFAALIFSFWIVVRNYRKQREQVKYLMYGIFLMAPAVVNDALSTMNLLPTPRIMVYAFLSFLGFMALQQADTVLSLYRSLRDQEEGLRELEKKKAKSILNISSEFQIIFNNMKDALSAANGKKMTGAPEKQIIYSATNLENILNDSNLLLLLEQGDYLVRNVRFGLQHLCTETIERVLAATQETEDRLTLSLPDEKVELSGDPDLLAVVMYHLVENALLYSVGRVEILVEKQSHGLDFSVRDEGPGISEEQEKIIFQKFVRGVDESDNIIGSGIGLSIVDLIAKQLSGKIRLDRAGGFFSTFVFSVPTATD